MEGARGWTRQDLERTLGDEHEHTLYTNQNTVEEQESAEARAKAEEILVKGLTQDELQAQLNEIFQAADTDATLSQGGRRTDRTQKLKDDVERFEAARSHRFSYVMRTRPDLYWRCSLPALSTLHMALHVPASATMPAPGAAMLHRKYLGTFGAAPKQLQVHIWLLHIRHLPLPAPPCPFLRLARPRSRLRGSCSRPRGPSRIAIANFAEPPGAPPGWQRRPVVWQRAARTAVELRGRQTAGPRKQHVSRPL